MFIINDITISDLPQLAKLYEQLANRDVDPEGMRETFEKITANGDYCLFGARAGDNRLVGTIMAVICHDLVKDCRPFMIMENLVVDAGWHRKGIGSLLMEKVESIARDRNCIFIEFCSSSFRTGAHSFYREAGYDPGEVKGFRKYF
ncbi:MAG: GNAT family N-acetyltransferase [Spirochaetes bacterium]|nr:GNAT family N-acetyltransferase [Spirochaetota bacterium]